MNTGDRVGSYILETELGKGVSATTWLAHAEGSESKVVLKILDLADTSSWNAVDIFKREAEALKCLSHPGIPRYIDYFESGENGRTRLVLAMERVEGRNLDVIVRSGQKFTEADVERMLADLSDILAYLGSLRPPIVHRDVNPRNVIMKPDGSLALVDFSGVQDAVRNALYPGATLVGTAGYIPLEQVAGKASHRSDLYGAAATAVFLLTGRNPAELPTSGLRIRLDGIVDISPRLAKVLGSWLDPDVSRRTLTALEAAALLRDETAEREVSEAPEEPDGLMRDEVAFPATAGTGASFAQQLIHQFSSRMTQPPEMQAEPKSQYPETLPTDSRIVVDRTDNSLRVKMPRRGLRGSTMAGAGFATVWVAFIAFWTMMTFMMRAPFIFPVFSIPFWLVGIFMVKTIFKPLISSQEIVVMADGFYLRTNIFGFDRDQSWPISDIGRISVTPSKMQVNGNRAKELSIETGTKRITLGTGFSERELLYIERTLNREIKKLGRL